VICEGTVCLESHLANDSRRAETVSAPAVLVVAESGAQAFRLRAVSAATLGVWRQPVQRAPTERPDSPGRSQAGRLSAWFFPALVAGLIALLVWPDLSRIAAGWLFLNAIQAESAGDRATAAQSLDQALLFQDSSWIYNQRGYLAALDADWRSATADFGQAVQLSGASGPATNNLVASYYNSGIRTAALRQLQEAAVLADPDSAITRYNLGVLLLENQRCAEAAQAFNRASQIEPDWAWPHLQRSLALLCLSDYPGAEAAALKALQRDPQIALGRLSLGLALQAQGKEQEALVVFENNLLSEPDNLLARFYRARLLYRRGATAKALAELENCLKISADPDQHARIAVEIEAIRRGARGGQRPALKGGQREHPDAQPFAAINVVSAIHPTIKKGSQP
jgi:tetratricopeptide (TPR) repeat protein